MQMSFLTQTFMIQITVRATSTASQPSQGQTTPTPATTTDRPAMLDMIRTPVRLSLKIMSLK